MPYPVLGQLLALTPHLHKYTAQMYLFHMKRQQAQNNTTSQKLINIFLHKNNPFSLFDFLTYSAIIIL